MTLKELLERYASGERDFGAIELSEANLSRVDLREANLSHAILSIANLSGANLGSANLSYAKMNVTRLSGANLVRANLRGTILNVANMIRANLSHADLVEAALIRAEMIRANLSHATLTGANLNGADLRESTLRQADLSGANLSETDLRGSSLVAAILTNANLIGTDFSKADLSGADLSNCELRHARLHRANLSGASLRGANLRWADLSGANLRWADLSGAKLSGANLIGADLSCANLLNASFVHADLTQANLIRADWEGADLSGAILTGAKLYGVARFNLTTEGMSCDWLDISPNGDHSKIVRFTSDNFEKFFNQTPPTVQIVVDMPIDSAAFRVLADLYDRIAEQYPEMGQPPSIDVGYRRTTLTFRTDSDEILFPTAYVAILPFQDAENTQKTVLNLIRFIQSQSQELLGVKAANQVAKLSVAITQRLRKVSSIECLSLSQDEHTQLEFFKAPTQTSIANSSNRELTLYSNATFGKRFDASEAGVPLSALAPQRTQLVLPSPQELLSFIQGFYSFDENR
ncbi:MAG: pentapeptide repeat-containing protein [Cyanobacteria bacterium SID2]|nr:pentapeptide repeat-containing protein [Cyanobacteria bacterium SID2]MBP0003982.1 pentapeptide repeat-containing protein [Cyanobacteria bacterium SBC]